MLSMETEPEKRQNKAATGGGFGFGIDGLKGSGVGILAVGAGVLLAAAFAAYRAHVDTKKKGKEPETTDLPHEETSLVEDAELASIVEELAKESTDEPAGFVGDPMSQLLPMAEDAEGREVGSRVVSVLWIGGSITAEQVEECKLMDMDFSTIFPTPAAELAGEEEHPVIEEDGEGDEAVGAHGREGAWGGGSDGHDGGKGTCGEEEEGGSFCAAGGQESREEIHSREAEAVDVHVDFLGGDETESLVCKEDGEEEEEEGEESDGTTVAASPSSEPASASPVWPAEMIGREMEMKAQLDLIHKAAISIVGFAKVAKAEYEIEEEEEEEEEEDEEEDGVKVPLSGVQVYRPRGIVLLVMVLAIVLGVFSAHYNGDLLSKLSYHIGQLVLPQGTKST